MKKILIISPFLQAAGAEKYAFELAKSLDKTKFNVEVLTTDDVFYNTEFPHVYYKKLIDIGIKVNTFLFKPKEKVFINHFFSNLPIIKYLVYRYNRYERNNGYKNKLFRLFNSQDAVILVDALHYDMVKSFINENVYFETHLMCHKVQFLDKNRIYGSYDLLKEHNFVNIDDYQLIEAADSGMRIGSSFKFPLSLNISEEQMILPIEKGVNSLNIGIFTRISPSKPLDDIILAFNYLNKINSEYRLYIFGYIQDEVYYSELIKEITKLDLEDKIIFMGHSDDMTQSCVNNNIKVVWVLSIFDFVGYAAVELCINNIPLILFNLDDNNSLKPINNETSIPPYFNDVNKLANYTNNVIENNGLDDLLMNERGKYLSENNLKKNIVSYEQYLLEKI